MIKNSCLDEETLTSYLEGLLDAPVRTAAETHLVDCDTCRSQLVYYMRILDEDVREEEESVVEAVMAAAEAPRLPKPEPKVRASSAKWIALAATVLMAVGAGLVMDRSARATAPEVLLEQLLRTDRPFQSRLSEQPYTALSTVRGADVKRGEPEYERTMRAAKDRQYLAAYLLYAQDFEEATRVLEGLAREMPSAAVYNDLGVAYLEADDSSDEERRSNQVRARGYFNQALDYDPGFDASAYNLVILAYRENQPIAQVQEQFERFIALGPNSAWVRELSRVIGVSIPAGL